MIAWSIIWISRRQNLCDKRGGHTINKAIVLPETEQGGGKTHADATKFRFNARGPEKTQNPSPMNAYDQRDRNLSACKTINRDGATQTKLYSQISSTAPITQRLSTVSKTLQITKNPRKLIDIGGAPTWAKNNR